ncbi:MAG: M48 family metallopeptidase [bacterium]
MVALLFLGCATTGPGGQKSLILISTSQEVALGNQFDDQIRTEAKVLADPQWQQYFNEIGQSVVAVCDRKDIEYHFTVIESDDVNAFATPGGYVYIYTGLLKLMDNEAQLAAVTAHEISHIVARHSIQRLQTAMGISLLEQLAFGGESSALQDVVNLGVGIALQGYSRQDEHQADEYGVIYMTRAGYNPEGAIELFGKLASLGDHQANVFEQLASSHPDTQSRIDAVEQQIHTSFPQAVQRPKNPSRYLQHKNRLPASDSATQTAP